MGKFLVCVDGTPAATKALELALKFINPETDELHIACGVKALNPVHYGMAAAAMAPMVSAHNKALTEKACEYVKQLAADCKDKVKVIHTEVLESHDVKDCFAEFINERDFDTVFVGTRGRGALKRFFAGSFSTYIVNHVKANVVVCRHLDDE
eukprot:TRINITY_DN20727_c0_g1_i1.p1 TRINITY_DN20727_c0_g1~~TRINITY_DN20727_c0_g1_i1.p1  ORF type:complete len:152 (-),score=44.87 TRINITY_DN20727_c0_g1_i1:221-676(-)